MGMIPGGASATYGARTSSTQRNITLSSIHAFWLASLLWLARRGWSLQLSKTELGLQGKVVQAEPALTPDHLAAWIEQF